MIRRALVCALLVSALCVGIARAADPVSLDEYRAIVAQTLALVEQAASASPAQQSEFLTRAATLLANVDQIRLPDNSIASINNDTLIAEIRAANGSTLPQVTARLRALRDALNVPLIAANETERAKLRDILTKPPFTQTDSQTWLQWLLNQFFEWLDSLLGRTVNGAFELRDWFAVGGILIVIGVIVYFLVSVRRHAAAEEALRLAEETGPISSQAAFKRATQFATTGDYRSAMRALYLATLFWLDEKGRLRYDRSLTNREYLRAVASDQPLREALRPVVETFDRVWYGFEKVTAPEFESYRAQVETIQHLSSQQATDDRPQISNN